MGKQVSRKKRIILIVCAAAFVAAAAAVLLGVLLTQLPGDKPPEVEYLPKSNKGEFIFAKRVGATRPDGKPVIIARSYDGNPWEAEPDLDNQPAEIECDDQVQCTMKFDGEYDTYSVDVPQQLKELTPMHLAARLYMQGGFGAPKDELLKIASTYGDNFGLWIQDQMRLTPTLARSYYRARGNARPGTFDVFPVNKPCDLNTRWRRFLFDSRDKLASSIQISLNSANQRFVVKVNGVVRGETWTLFNKPYPATGYTFPLNLRLCSVVERLDGYMSLSMVDQPVCTLSWANPAIDFIPNNYIQSLGPNDAVLAPVVGNTGAIILKFRSVSCSGASDGAGHYYIRQSNITYMFDPRIKLYRNTPEEPSVVDSAAGQCPVVAQAFNNRDQCVRRSTCSGAASFKFATFTLNDDILRSWYTKSRRYVYYVTDLRLEEPYDVSPCSSGVSRWKRIGKGTCTSPTALDSTTKTTISAALAASSDTNPYVRDITLTGANCSPTTATIGAFVDAAGECFQHVQPDLYSVRDFTRWVDTHDGNKDAMAGGNPNPIAKWAESGSTNLKFPALHPMTRFYDRRGYIPIVGRFGDQVDFLALSSDLQTEEIATIVGALRVDPGSELFIACGSPGETENIPELGYHYNVWNFNSSRGAGQSTDALEWPMPGNYDHIPLIENLAMKSPDQLRQRVAWTLSNTFIVSTADTTYIQFLDAWAGYYDIFTRNAFGNYKDILSEVSYHPLMGVYLTYYGNQAYAVYNSYPDENYAREIMQLFSIGLWRLNDDGTQKLDSSGNPMETYTNDDIVDFSRVWTGFIRRPNNRGNLASIFQFGGTPNVVDPMVINPSWRDRFPKAKLDSGYLGDTYPLCDDMPAQTFLREGARYEYTGTYSVEGDLIDNQDNTTSGLRGRFTPPTTSALYQALCAPSTSGGACTFPLVVTLTSNLPCTGTQECNAQRVIAVKIVDPVANMTRYYNYIGLPCVRMTLFNQGQTVFRVNGRAQCVDPVARVAYPMCCNTTTGVVSKAQSECLFANEATDYATNQQRCAALGLRVCSAAQRAYTSTNWANTCAINVFSWTNTTCTMQVQVYQSGQIGLIDPLPTYTNILKPSSNNVFRVRWENDAYPIFDGKCPEGCAFQATPDAAGSCICNITVTASTIFGQLSDLNSINADDAVNVIAQKATIGSVKPSIYDDGTYTTCGSSECTRLNNVVVWLHKDDNGGLSDRTIFQLPPFRLGGRVRYLMNKISTVTVSNSFSFRNPPNFIPLLGELSDINQPWTSDNLWTRRAENEVDALLEHLFEHDNTAVFVCYRLIQHMVTSNPSPRYMKSVVNAFRTGAYGSIRFSGKYGDMGAAVYAVLIDQEARSPIVEVDRTYGMLKDPLVKLYQFMRTFEYTSTKGREVGFWYTDQVFGVQPFTSPSVFGFYLPEYRPDGVIGNAGLVSPQAQIATTPNLVGFFNGITSLVDNGLTSCDGGLAIPHNNDGRTCVATGPHPTADGVLAYAPPDGASIEDIVDDINMILLGGRLASQTRDLFIREYNNIHTNDTMAPQALRHLLKLFAISAEFQATNFNNVTPEPRTFTKAVPSQGRRFKAVIVVNQVGGCDSFNLLVPHSNCPKKDMYAEYISVRTDAALDKSNLLDIDVPAGTQPCNTFGVHSVMGNLTQLYKDGDALFVANAGALVEPVTNKVQVNKRTARLPPFLFAHNIMQRNVQNVHAQMPAATGILGRITDALLESNPPYSSGLFSFGGLVKMVQGSTPADYVSASGFVRVRGLNKIGAALEEITKYSTESVFSDTYADSMHYALSKTEVLSGLLSNTTVSASFGSSWMDLQFKQIAKLIKLLPDNGAERAVFYTATSGFDTHSTFDLDPFLSPIDVALGSFVNEMKAQGKWDDVVIMTVSDFGRTLTSNGKGTDHAWGGNYWVAGGSVKGGQVLGKYPEVITDDGDLILSRGRVVPTTPFESIWQGISEWFGVPADQMQKVLPNLNNFGDDVHIPKEKMFKK